ncbi:PREDICTED: uncharacterized protein LOC108381095 [Rhagoletis zephyria]|uniref:uncharacterized protein LOC108381095 n=1 Tax=Rhagoletis zephyria TaxID=28612 RepID=UPI000811935D|nr:PREDICTED: uncharacterized protein LOC108381095 [Rhagoletis zephyria]
MSVQESVDKYSSEDAPSLIALQIDRIDTLKQVLKNFRKDSATRKTKSYFEHRLNNLQELRSSFKATHEHIVRCLISKDDEYFKASLSAVFDELYLDTYCTIKDTSDEKYPASTAPVNSDSDCDIQQMPLTSTNYTIAWSLCEKRYNNPRILFMHCMNSIYSLPSIGKERAADIKSLLNAAKVCVNECNRLKVPINGCDHWLAYFLSTKLPNETRKAWELALGSKSEIPTFADLEQFLNNRLVLIDVFESRDIHENLSHSATEKVPKASKFTRKSHHSSVKTSGCILCSESHVIRKCPKFLDQDCFERKNIVSQHKLCLNCLSKGHSSSQCTSTQNCHQCGQRHHTLLHFPSSSFVRPGGIPNVSAAPFLPPANHCSALTNTHSSNHTRKEILKRDGTPSLQSNLSKGGGTVLLATALVSVHNGDPGQSNTLRALVDQGSECTLISERATQRLSLKRTRAFADITGLGHNASNRSRFTVQLHIRSCIDPQQTFTIDQAYVLPSLTDFIPGQRINPQSWPHLQGLELADPHYYEPSKIDLILGADVYSQFILPEIRIGEPTQPIAQRTSLGWVLLGKVSNQSSSTFSSNRTTIRCHHSSLELASIVQHYFEQDQIPQDDNLTSEEQWCEMFFKQTHQRQPEGRYVVRLPLKSYFDPSQTLGRSRQIALNRYHRLERKLDGKPQLRERYAEVMQEYFDLGQISPVKSTEKQHSIVNAFHQPTNTSCVLPHHAVFKEESTSTKLRIVFDASCKTSNGRSLNDLLCVGPPLQNELPAVILNWRMHKFVFTADIQKMYRCINMHPEDAQYQRILWRDQNREVQEYCLTTVTFGTASAPYTAIRVLHQLAEDERSRYPLAEHILKSETYVDDVLSGSHSIPLAI